MDKDNDANDGITLQTVLPPIPPDETTTIDWDAVLRDFAAPRTPTEAAQTPQSPPLPTLLLFPNRI